MSPQGLAAEQAALITSMTERLKALNEKGSSDFSFNKMPKCPHCAEDFDISDQGAWRLYDENDTHEVECPSCDLSFLVNSWADWRFSTDTQED